MPVCQYTWSPSQKFLDSQFDPLQEDCDFGNTSPKKQEEPVEDSCSFWQNMGVLKGSAGIDFL